MKIFISYQHRTHQAFADQLADELKAVKIRPHSINLQLTYGNDITKKVGEVLRGCAYVIVLLTKSYTESIWLKRELAAFLHHEWNCGTNIIIPVLLEDCVIDPHLEDRVCDIRGKSIDEGFAQLATRISPARQVFVIMKFGDKMLDYAYEVAIKPVIEEFVYKPVRVDKIQDSGKVTDQILKHIERSDIVLADLTGERPNCYYEAGYADASQKELILTIRKDSKVHFDLAGNRFIKWESEAQLKEALRERFKYIQEKQAIIHSKFKSPFA